MLSRARADSTNALTVSDQSAAVLLAEHQSRGRESRVASVSYADIGHVRHDGSRARANSNESERGGLLEGAATMGEARAHHRVASGSSSFFSVFTRAHGRNRSTSSLSISTTTSDVDHAPHLRSPPVAHGDHRRSSSGQINLPGHELSRMNNDATPTATPRSSQEASHNNASNDIADYHIPPPIGGPSFTSQPPNYDPHWAEAPAYQSPIAENNASFRRDLSSSTSLPPNEQPSELHDNSATRATAAPTSSISRYPPRLPSIKILPSISVEGATEPNTPSSPVRRVPSPAI